MKTFKKKFSIPLAKPAIGLKEKKLVNLCLQKNWISSIGEYVSQFAQEFGKKCRVKHALPTSNGTTALHLALIAAGIKPGDEVIVPALTFVATANAVVYCGAKPIFIDCELKTWNIDIEKIEKKITKKTKAIIPVHLYGHPVDMDKINLLARKYKLTVIEDAAESLGSLYKNKPTGSLGDIGCFSFFGNKIITTGEGGMLVTNNKKFYETAKLYRDQGKVPKVHPYWHSVIGYNYAMTNLQAAVGIGQLERLDRYVRQKRKIANTYNKYLKDIKGIAIPCEEIWAKSNFWMYSILVDQKQFGISRDQLIQKLKDKGIETRPFFYPNPLLPFYKKTQTEKFSPTKKISNMGINLPTFASLSLEEIKFITKQIKKAANNS